MPGKYSVKRLARDRDQDDCRWHGETRPSARCRFVVVFSAVVVQARAEVEGFRGDWFSRYDMCRDPGDIDLHVPGGRRLTVPS